MERHTQSPGVSHHDGPRHSGNDSRLRGSLSTRASTVNTPAPSSDRDDTPWNGGVAPLARDAHVTRVRERPGLGFVAGCSSRVRYPIPPESRDLHQPAGISRTNPPRSHRPRLQQGSGPPPNHACGRFPGLSGERGGSSGNELRSPARRLTGPASPPGDRRRHDDTVDWRFAVTTLPSASGSLGRGAARMPSYARTRLLLQSPLSHPREGVSLRFR